MTDITASPAVPAQIADRFARLSTGIKMFLLLSLALLPLGIIALFASLQTTRSADIERRALLRVSLNESARRLGSEIGIDVTALRSAGAMLERGVEEHEVCNRTASILATFSSQPTRFALMTRGGRQICQTPGYSPRPISKLSLRAMTVTIDSGEDALRLLLPSATGAYVATASYPNAQLARTVRPSSFGIPYAMRLSAGDHSLDLAKTFVREPWQRSEALSAPVAGIPASLEIRVRSAPFTPSEILTMFLPLLMCAAAAGIGWLLIDRLVLRPLAQLRATVATYRPGEILQPFRTVATPAKEIKELGDTFRSITETVAAHECELALGLTRQTKLTREVHHRVKNNLQVVSSLINLHSRGARVSEEVHAYSSIGRRVDALAVVHRNHFAELEENLGVALKPLIGEIAQNLRATAPPESQRLAILIDVPAHYVGQDTAIPVAFLITELVELAMGIEPDATVKVSVVEGDAGGRACLVIKSSAFFEGDELKARIDERYGRVIEGLSRQLRSPLIRDFDRGVFSVCFPIVESDPDPAPQKI